MRLGDIVRESRRTYKGDKTDIPIVGLEHLVSGELKFSEYELNTDNTFNRCFHKGQILFGRRRAYLKKAAVAEFDGICSGDITVIEAIPGKVDERLLPFIIQNDRLFDFAVSRSAGGLSPRVKWEHLADYELELPSIEEQRVLAEKLWAAYELKEAYKKMIAATDEMVKSQFIEMFKGDDQVPLGDICNIEKGATITRNDVLPGDIPVVAGGQEPSCYHNVANREAGAITVSASGAYAGYINLWSCPIFASDCNTVISKDAEKTDQTFVYFGLKAMQKQIYGLQKGGAQPHVYGKDLQKFMFPHPSYAKQIEFSKMAKQADKSKFVGFKSQFIEMFEFEDLSLLNPSDDFSVKCIDDTSSATKVPAGEYLGNGTYAIYDQSQDCEVAGYTDSHEGLCNNYPAVLFGDHSRVVKYINQPFFIGADGVKIIRPKNDDLLAEFLYYDLLYHNIPDTGYNRHFKYVKMLKLTEASVDRQKAFLGIAHQADKSKYIN